MARFAVFPLSAAALLSTSAVASEHRAVEMRDDAAAEAFATDDGGVLSLTHENDLFGSDGLGADGRDRWYTSGLHGSYLSPAAATPWLRASAANAVLGDGPRRLEISVGQDIFTPNNTSIGAPIPDDRPYGGFLFLGVDAVSLNPNRRLFGVEGLVEDHIGLRIGAVGGSASLAEFTQATAHEIVGSVDPQGYDNGLKSEPGLNLMASRDFRIFGDAPLGLGYELRPSATVALGTVETHVGAGGVVRVGRNLELDLERRDNRAGVSGGGFFKSEGGIAWAFFAGAQGRAIAHNVYLDGNVFRDGPDDAIDVDGRSLVADFMLGVSVSAGPVRGGFTYLVRTREFDEQDDVQTFGSVTFSVRF